ncbi:MAG: nucleoside deaminase [Planctomycetes bacterium]|nr:nucleoside deaminase [Planctomycetota bacterium]
MDYRHLMGQAIAQARKGILDGQTPFGAVIANDRGDIIVAANNSVRADCDSTAHAEVNAIRLACRKVCRIDLSGYMMVTTCEPCPMCAAAVHWARLDEVVFGATIDHAAGAGFHELTLACRTLYETGGSQVRIREGVLEDECRKLFEEWRLGRFPTPY